MRRAVSLPERLSFLSPRRVLVTGAAGFIGSHLCEALVARGDDVVALDNFDPFYASEIKRRNLDGLLGNERFELVEGDLRDGDRLADLFDRGRYEAVVHLGAKAGVRPSLEDPVAYMSVNVEGTARLLAAMLAADCRRLVFGSSSSVYGNRVAGPFREDDRVDAPVSPYAMSKKAGEELCHVFHAAHGFDVLCLRFFTVYGPRQRPEMAIHLFTRLLLEGRPIPVFGDGSMERDYTYVDDIVAGVVAAIDRVAGIGYAVVNLGGSRPVSLSDLVGALGEATGMEPEVEHHPAPAADVERTFASVERARDMLGFEPRIDLATGLERFVAWYRRTLSTPAAGVAGP